MKNLLNGLLNYGHKEKRLSFLTDVYHNREDYSELQQNLNKSLGLTGDYRLQADHLPTFGHGGSPSDKIIIVGVNPGYDEENNYYENSYKLKSVDNYISFFENFYDVYPNCGRKKTSPWWTKTAIITEMFSSLKTKKIQWEKKHGQVNKDNIFKLHKDMGKLYCMDLIPFHSKKDGMSNKILSNKILRKIAFSSLEGHVAVRPVCLVFLSIPGFEIAKAISEDNSWTEKSITGSKGKYFRYAFGKYKRIPIIAIRNQILVQSLIKYDEWLPIVKKDIDMYLPTLGS